MSWLDFNEEVSLLRQIEAFAWLRPYWKWRERVFDRRARRRSNAIPRIARQNRYFRYLTLSLVAKHLADYGRALNFSMKARVTKLVSMDMPQLRIRDGVIGRIIAADGSLVIGHARKFLILALGIGWHTISSISIALLCALAISLPGSWPTKLLVTGFLVIFYLLTLGFMNALTLRPVIAWSVFERVALNERGTTQ